VSGWSSHAAAGPAYASIVVAVGALRWNDQRSRISLLVDLLLAAVAVYAAIALTAEIMGAAPPRVTFPAYTVAALHGASVAVRRLAPVAAVVVLLSTAGVYGFALGLPVFMLGPAVLLVAYGVGVALALRPAAVLLAVIEAALVLLLRFGPGFPGWASVLLFASLVAGSWYLGVFARRWQSLAAENAQRARDLEAARHELARHAVAAERLRIARELHDVVAHSMSVIAMHAGAARLAVGTNPASERAALDVIESSSREALGEMRRLVTVLREEDADAAERSPVPGLADLPTLVASVAAGGPTVDVQTEGDLEVVPSGLSLAAYRVIQEALTNVVRHAGHTSAHVMVQARPDKLVVRVENAAPSGSVRNVASAGGGHGTVGMRERVELYGGTLRAGPSADGGWSVEARLPYGVEER
jgi:signal transduction histidine kinase